MRTSPSLTEILPSTAGGFRVIGIEPVKMPFPPARLTVSGVLSVVEATVTERGRLAFGSVTRIPTVSPPP